MANVVFTKTFLFDLLKVPKTISQKTLKEIRILRESPEWGRINTLQGTGRDKINYKRITRKYRLLYFCQNNTTKILRLNVRNESTYTRQEIEYLVKNAHLDPNKEIYFEDCSSLSSFEDSDEQKNNDELEESTAKPCLLNENILNRLKIPKQYRQKLLGIDNENEIFDLDLPEKYENALIDFVTLPTNADNEYESDIDNLNKFVDGNYEINSFLATFLKLDKEQEKYTTLNLDKENNKCILIKGTAGTGKSLIAFHRVKKILEKYPNSKILFATYSKTLANYSKRILTLILNCDPTDRGIDVFTTDELSTKYYVRKNNTPQLASKNLQAEILKQIINTLRSNKETSKRVLNRLEELGSEFILDEFIKIIEAQEIKDIKTYEKVKREGQIISLGSRQRRVVWNIYEKWKQTITHDYNYQIQEWIDAEAFEIAKNQNNKKYDYVIVDEVQDLSPIALKLLIALAKSYSGIYLTSDTTQSIYQKIKNLKHISKSEEFKNISFDIKTLRKNYRNTQSILNAAISLLPKSNDDKFIDPEVLFLERSTETGYKPEIVLVDESCDQFSLIEDFFIKSEKEFGIPRYEGAILSNNYPDLMQDYVAALNHNGIKSKYIESNCINNNSSINSKAIKVMSIHDAKGLEFPFVCITDFTKEKLPRAVSSNASNSDKTEFRFQQLRLLYVACSRAVKKLLVIGSKHKPSDFLSLINDKYWTMKEL